VRNEYKIGPKTSTERHNLLNQGVDVRMILKCALEKQGVEELKCV
jgi:hypothetical protein